MLKKIGLGALMFTMPVFVFAQNFTIVNNFFTQVQNLVSNVLIPLVFAIAILVFFWGVVTYVILGASDEAKRASGRSLMIYAVIAFFVMTALWGIVTLLGQVLGVNSNANVNLPNIPRN